MEIYLYWNSEIEISSYPNGANLLEVKNFTESEILVKRNTQFYQINDVASEILQLFNGEKTYKEVIDILSEKYNELFETVNHKVDKFLKNIKDTYNIYLIEQNVSQKRNIKTLLSSSLYPIVATIEVTDRCNLKCRHCYGNYKKTNINNMSLEQIKKLLQDLKNIGVRIIELTGGEVTTHPNIEEIIEYALAMDFESVTILSNGVSMSKKLLNILKKNKEKICIQIDLHSLNEKYMTWFTGRSNIIDSIKKNISVIAESDIRMRVITIITKHNMQEIEEIADYVHEVGARQYAASLVIPMGRAMGESDLLLDEADLKMLDKVMTRINKKYEGFLSIIRDGAQRSINCGCLTSNVVISPIGNIKICAMNSLKDINCNIGNVFREDIKMIYDRQSEFFGAFYDAKAPKMYLEECKECENASYCHGCMLRGLSKAKLIGGKCLWYNTQISPVIKAKLGY